METEDILLQADISGSEDEGEDDRKHNQLVDAISCLDGKNRHKLSQRTVPTNQVSEFNFATSGEGASKVRLHELVGSLKDTAKLGNLKRQFNLIDKRKKVISTPLPKHEKQKIDRTVAYDNTKQDISKWETVVSKNRLAEQLQFPLQKPDFKLATIDDFVKRFEPRTPLEVQVAALLKGSDHVIKDKSQELTPAEQRALRAMDIQEARERHAELMKHKALLSYQEAKARWRNKIKSKRYHRMLKRTRLKQDKKALDELEKNDPEAYTEKLRQLERDRVEERMSLKHRGGSKYAKKQMIYAKYDNKAREQVQDMLQKSRELTKKTEAESDSENESEGGVSLDSDDETRMLENQLQSEVAENPWMVKVGPKKKEKNPWMAKSGTPAAGGSNFSRPEAFTSTSAVVDIGSDNDEDISNDVTYTVKRIRTTGKDAEDETTKLTSKLNRSKLKNENDTVADELGDESNGKEDDIDKIFSTGPKKSKLIEAETKKKVKRKKKKKKQAEEADTAKKQRNGSEASSSNKDFNSKTNSKDKNISVDVDDDDNDVPLISEGLNRKRTLEEIENSDSEVDVEEPKKVRKDGIGQEEDGTEKRNVDKEVHVDPQKLFTLDSKLKQIGSAPDLVDDDGDLDPDEQQRLTIAQAFADDDVIEEFQREKEADIDKNKPKDIDLTLPGWGEWGGAGVVVSKKKKKRFRIKAPPAPPRRDMHLGNVIINEQKASAITKHQVNELPYPFLNAEQFEKSIRVPLGKTWNPETAFRELVKPKVVTKLGKIITPIDKSEVYKKTKKQSDSKKDFAFNVPRRSNYKRGDNRKKHGKDKQPIRKEKKRKTK